MFSARSKAVSVGAAVFAGATLGLSNAFSQTAGPLVFVNQGPDWTRSLAAEFYVTDQGSRIMPLAWMRALTLPDGTGFLDDGLARYNYLANPASRDALPIGFTVAPSEGRPTISMTCSACHTREIEVTGTHYRIDGGPAMTDFQSFLAALEAASSAALASDDAFNAFAARAAQFGESANAATVRAALEAWHVRFSAIVTGSLPDPAWGPGRLDAISMIFNRLTGLDIGHGPDHLIRENIAVADAPTRYPFLWNAPRQDQTQWPGFADNGNSVLGLARNLGQVYGVFGEFHPIDSDSWFGLNKNYLEHNSANFDGLGRLEELVWLIGPPRWPWPIDQKLADRGEAIFNRDSDAGGCVSCHGVSDGDFRFPNWTWQTPVKDVGTDTRECKKLARTVKSGVMDGAKIPFVGEAIGATAPAVNLLSTAVVGAIIQHKVPGGVEHPNVAMAAAEVRLSPELETLKGAFGPASKAPPVAMSAAAEPGCKYEARVLRGIWAAAPYLHNGSVPSVTELLKPAQERVASFKLGPRYDIEAVGLAAEQDVFDFTLATTNCDDRSSGRSRCGHEYGTSLSADERRALLEYLKAL